MYAYWTLCSRRGAVRICSKSYQVRVAVRSCSSRSTKHSRNELRSLLSLAAPEKYRLAGMKLYPSIKVPSLSPPSLPPSLPLAPLNAALIYIVGAVGLLCISSGVTMALPFAVGKFIDVIYKTDDSRKIKETLIPMCQILGVVFLAGAVANFGRVYLIQTSGKQRG